MVRGKNSRQRDRLAGGLLQLCEEAKHDQQHSDNRQHVCETGCVRDAWDESLIEETEQPAQAQNQDGQFQQRSFPIMVSRPGILNLPFKILQTLDGLFAGFCRFS